MKFTDTVGDVRRHIDAERYVTREPEMRLNVKDEQNESFAYLIA